MAIDDEQLPKVNKRREKCNEMEWKLRTHLRQAISDFESKNNYKFEPYERDYILLKMVQDNHNSYITTKFGPERI